MAVATPKSETQPKKVSSDTEFYLSTEEWEDTFLRNLVKHALKKGSFLSITYPYRFAHCLIKFGYIPKSIAGYSTIGNQRALRIPSVREYMNFMKENEGDWLWMRGEISFCFSRVLYDIVEAIMREFLMRKSKSDKSLREEYLECLYVTSVSAFVAVVATQPLAILTYRQIGQYVSKEDIYSSALEFINVFTKPGILSFLGGILVRYVLVVTPTICGNIAGRTWENWLVARIPWLPHPEKFLKATDKGTNLEWLRPTIEWCIDASVYYWVAVALYPLDIAFITSCVWDSGITVGSEPFLPQGHFFKRLVSMWRDGKLSRSSSFYFPQLTTNMDAFVVL